MPDIHLGCESVKETRIREDDNDNKSQNTRSGVGEGASELPAVKPVKRLSNSAVLTVIVLGCFFVPAVYLAKCVFEYSDLSRVLEVEQRQESLLSVQKIIAREVRFSNRKHSPAHQKMASEKLFMKDKPEKPSADEPSAKKTYGSYAKELRESGKVAQARLFETAISNRSPANENLTENLFHAAEVLRSSGFEKDGDWLYKETANHHLCSCKPRQSFDSEALLSIGRMNIPILRSEGESGISLFISQCKDLIKDARSKNANPRCIAELEAIVDANVDVVDIIEWTEISLQD